MSITTIIYIFGIGLAVLLMFGLSIFVHELGHFLVGRKLGLKVEAFAIGFGPVIKKWTKDGIEYSIRWLPFGGFVRLPQMISAEAIEGSSSTDPLPPAPALTRIIVALSGPLMNLAFAFIVACLIYVVGLPIRQTPPIVGIVEKGSESEKAGLKTGDKIIAISGHKIKTWEELTDLVVLSRTNKFDLQIERQGTITNISIIAKINHELGLKWLDFWPLEHPIVGTVEPSMPAAKAGLRPGDRIISFNDIPIATGQQLINLISKNEGRICTIEIDRNGKHIQLEVQPIYDPKTGRARIGIVFATTVYYVIKPGPLPWEQVASAFQKSIRVLSALVRSKETGVQPKHLSGPVGILGWLAIQTRTDIRLALDFLVLLNVGLMILNLLPIPVLDGGHILFALWEGITGILIPKRILEAITMIFALLLICLMLYVTYFDINRLPSLFGIKSPVRELPVSTNVVNQP